MVTATPMMKIMIMIIGRWRIRAIELLLEDDVVAIEGKLSVRMNATSASRSIHVITTNIKRWACTLHHDISLVLVRIETVDTVNWWSISMLTSLK